MPRSSRSKAHKQSKHTSREAGEHSDLDDDVKMKERSGKEDGSVRVSKDSVSGEKRKLPLQSKDRDLQVHGNGDASEEYGAPKRRKDKAAEGGSDRWDGGGDMKGGEGVTVDKEMRGENLDKAGKARDSKAVAESKSKSSRRHDGGSEKKEDYESAVAEKSDGKNGSNKSESKRKLEKESGRKEGHHYKDSNESKDMDRGYERERKVQDVKHDPDARAVDGEGTRKKVADQQGKKERENNDWIIDDELRNPELEKELEKRIKRRAEGSSVKERYHDDARESEDRWQSARDIFSKESRHKDEKHIDKHRDDGDRETRRREDKYREDGEKDSRRKDIKCSEDGERDTKRRDDKYREDNDRDNRYHDFNRDNGRHKDEKYREESERDSRCRDDKYRDRDDRSDRNRDDKYREDSSRDHRHKEEKHREDVDRESRRRDSRLRDDVDSEKRIRDSKYRDVSGCKDHPIDSETKRFRDDSNTADAYYRKSGNRDASPNFDDRGSRYKDDKDGKRGSEREETGDFSSRSVKEQCSDVDKRHASTNKVDTVNDRGRVSGWNSDLEITASHSHCRSSPSSGCYAGRDSYRLTSVCRAPKPEETKYKDHAYEERFQHNVTSTKDFPSPAQTERISSSRSQEKMVLKDGSRVSELSAERRLISSDSWASPFVDKSPSSTSTDRRHLNRSNVRRNLDIEEMGHKNGSFKDDKGIRDLPLETSLVDELSQANEDTLYVSSPYSRNAHFSSNSKYLLPPPPFRTGSDSNSSGFGPLDDDSRGNKPNYRHRRMGDPNIGRSPWKGVPSWPSPMANGYIPFPHGPPPIGFHPVMPQFPPPIFGVRPPMELNHNGIPYHVPENEGFSGHVRPWRGSMDDSIPPLLNGWDVNNMVFSEESRVLGRMDWDHSRNAMSNRGWETSGDVWKSQNSGPALDFLSAIKKEEYPVRGLSNETESKQNQVNVQSEEIKNNQLADAVEEHNSVATKAVPESPHISEISVEEDPPLLYIYLSKVDVSEELTQPDLYNQYTSMVDLDQAALSDEFDCKFLLMEEAVQVKVSVPDKSPVASFYIGASDSVFQKAMSLYKKQKEDCNTVAINKAINQTSNCEKAGWDTDEPVVGSVAAVSSSVLIPTLEKSHVNADVVLATIDKTVEKTSSSEEVEMEVKPIPSKEGIESVIESEAELACKVEEACEVVTGESVEFGSVNLCRILHSPESTH